MFVILCLLFWGDRMRIDFDPNWIQNLVHWQLLFLISSICCAGNVFEDSLAHFPLGSMLVGVDILGIHFEILLDQNPLFRNPTL